MNDVESILDREARRLIDLAREMGAMEPGAVTRTFVKDDGTMAVEVIPLKAWLARIEEEEP